MKKEYTSARLEVLNLEAEDIVTNSLPWMSGATAEDGDTMNNFWTYEE